MFDARPPPLNWKVEEEVKAEKKRISSALNLDLSGGKGARLVCWSRMRHGMRSHGFMCRRGLPRSTTVSTEIMSVRLFPLPAIVHDYYPFPLPSRLSAGPKSLSLHTTRRAIVVVLEYQYCMRRLFLELSRSSRGNLMLKYGNSKLL